MRLDTLAVHAGGEPDKGTGAAAMSIFLQSLPRGAPVPIPDGCAGLGGEVWPPFNHPLVKLQKRGKQ